ncbi:serine hydrolase domain-containing protein [Glaciecola sp. 1036]|uniref:serine hydrolase domain-containing protein n=1 Tax=Alteromonadaceae TaxID=72275 RepID=UPI003D0032A0
MKNQIVNQTSVELMNTTLKGYVESGQVAGVSAIVFEKGKEVYFNAFGFANLEQQTPMNRDTIVRIYSMTKPVTGVALMQLYEQGKFKMDDPLAWYLPEFANQQVCTGVNADGEMQLAPPKRAITVRDITRHTAGFSGPNDSCTGDMVKAANAYAVSNTLTQTVQKIASIPLAFHPGEQWSYGVSVDVQARLVEVLSGQNFDDYIQANIFDPLNMNTIGYKVADANMTRFSPLYNLSEQGILTQIPETEGAINVSDVNLTPGGWGLTSTIDDYARFARMLVNQGELEGARLLKAETVRAMASNHLDPAVTERSWLPSKGQVGFGVDFAVRLREPVDAQENYGEVGEFFWDGMASTLFWVDPKNELVAVLFVQLLPYDPIRLHKNFRDAVYGKTVK